MGDAEPQPQPGEPGPGGPGEPGPVQGDGDNARRRRQRNRSRGWCFTLNHPTELELVTLRDQAEVTDAKYIWQEETGEAGNRHIQGFIYFSSQTAFSTLRQWNSRIHWERTRDVAASVKYCSDIDKRTGRIWARGYTYSDRNLRIIDFDNLYDWQRELLQELDGEPDMRSVIWYADTEGGCGKTALCRYLVKNVPDTMFVSSGSAKDITYQVVKSQQEPKNVIFNLPRSAEGAMSYAAIESLKDGLLFSGKYEGGVKLFPPPHVIIFANFLPDYGKLSLDRWVVRHLSNNPPRIIQ